MDKRGALGLFRFLSGQGNPYKELIKLKVKDIMSKDVLTIARKKSLTEAAHTMVGSHISCLVVTDDREPIGILTERDFIKKFGMEKESKQGILVEDLMTPKVVTIDSGIDLFEAQRIMRKNNFRKLVMAEKGEVSGIITQSDLCKAVANLKTPIVDSPKVSDVMTRKVMTATPEDSFKQVKKLMAQRDMGSVVVTEKDVIVGIFTEFDIVSEYFFNPNRLKNSYMRHLMTSPVFCISPNFPLSMVNKYMIEKNFRRFPIIENGKLVGIITQTDVAKALYEHLEKNKDKNSMGVWKYKEPEKTTVKRGNVVLCELKK
jgi:CBS domain-containing protein